MTAFHTCTDQSQLDIDDFNSGNSISNKAGQGVAGGQNIFRGFIVNHVQKCLTILIKRIDGHNLRALKYKNPRLAWVLF